MVKHALLRVAIALTLTALSACDDGNDTQAEAAAREMMAAADDCLMDVRDRGMPYQQSPSCTTKLSRASKRYTDRPVRLTYTDETVIPRHAYLAEVAKSTAWSAAALSNGMHKTVPAVHSLW